MSARHYSAPPTPDNRDVFVTDARAIDLPLRT